jgi:hypothetical protein
MSALVSASSSVEITPPTEMVTVLRLYLAQREKMDEAERRLILDLMRLLSEPSVVRSRG